MVRTYDAMPKQTKAAFESWQTATIVVAAQSQPLMFSPSPTNTTHTALVASSDSNWVGSSMLLCSDVCSFSCAVAAAIAANTTNTWAREICMKPMTVATATVSKSKYDAKTKKKTTTRNAFECRHVWDDKNGRGYMFVSLKCAFCVEPNQARKP